MKKLVLSASSFQHSNAEEQKNSLLSLVEASKTFGADLIQKGLKAFAHGGAMKYNNASVGYTETKTGGSYALTLREYNKDSKYLEHKNEQTTILLGWGFNPNVLTGDEDISNWGNKDRYIIEDVSIDVIKCIENTTVSNYWDLDSLVKSFKETGIWDESLIEEEEYA